MLVDTPVGEVGVRSSDEDMFKYVLQPSADTGKAVGGGILTKVPIINQHEKPRETTIPAQTPREFVHGNNMAAKKKPSRGPPMRPAMVLISWWSKPVSFDISIAKPNSTIP